MAAQNKDGTEGTGEISNKAPKPRFAILNPILTEVRLSSQTQNKRSLHSYRDKMMDCQLYRFNPP